MAASSVRHCRARNRGSMTIRAVKRDVYGVRRVYCLNKDHERAIELMTGKKTLSPEIVRGLELLGLQVEVIDPYAMEEIA